MWKFWLLLAGFFLIIEIINSGFLIFWFSLGSLIAMFASIIIPNVVVQSIIFLISSVILLFSTRSFVQKMMSKTEHIKTNVYSMEGKIGKVVETIKPEESTGQVKVSGELWSAKSYNDLPIPKDTEIIIEQIDGVKLVVKPLN